MNEQLIVLDNPLEMENILAYLDDKDLVTYDTETTGVHHDCEVVGMSLCAETDKAYYLITAYWDPETKTLIRSQAAWDICQRIVCRLKVKQLVMHNAIFDCRVTYDTWKVQLIQSVFSDTMIAAHILDEEGPRGLKELGKIYFGADATKEQAEMKASVLARGGIWEDKKIKAIKEMYKADPQILGKYGAKDALLTYRLFFAQADELIAQGLDKFFFEDESMPLLRDVTYDLNTVGLKVDIAKLKQFEQEMTHEVGRLKVEIDEEVAGYVKERPKFSVNSPQQLSWLLFVRLGQKFRSLTPAGKEVSKALTGKLPYTDADKRRFLSAVNEARNMNVKKLEREESRIAPIVLDFKTDIKLAQSFKNRKAATPDEKAEAAEIIESFKIQMKAAESQTRYLKGQVARLYPEKYIQADKATLQDLAGRYTWVKKLLKMKSEDKLLGTYVKGILSRVRYGVIYPRFNQTGTDSGRYSSSDPNFQNLPRDDKRIKSCVISRTGRVFIGADYSQLEPRVFASVSQDPRLLQCFELGEDFYSVVGIKIFGRHECSAYKKDPNYFGADPDPKDPASMKRWPRRWYPEERQIAKSVCLAAAYGTTAAKLAQMLRHPDGRNFSIDECQDIINRYFEQFPGVRKMMLDSHAYAKKHGEVFTLYGRRRRIPDAIRVARMYPGIPHDELDYQERTPLNLAMNVRVQGSAASIVNRACIAFKAGVKERALTDKRWLEVYVVSQIHDEIIAEGPEELGQEISALLRHCMEQTTTLPGVRLVAEPKIAHLMSDLK